MTTITAVIIIIITIEVRKKEISSVKHKSIEREWETRSWRISPQKRNWKKEEQRWEERRRKRRGKSME